MDVKRLLFVAVCLFACSSRSEAFPSQQQVKSKLRAGLAADEVVALFGEPSGGRVVPCANCTFTYIPPLGSVTVNKNGYTGLRIHFKDGKVKDWTVYTSNPSYAEPKMPANVRRFLWFFGIIFAVGILSKLLIRITPIAAAVSREVAQAFENREIRSEDLPSEFRFINHDTTLQEVIDKAGKPSRVVRIPISAESGLGYALVSSNTSKAAIVTYAAATRTDCLTRTHHCRFVCCEQVRCASSVAATPRVRPVADTASNPERPTRFPPNANSPLPT